MRDDAMHIGVSGQTITLPRCECGHHMQSHSLMRRMPCVYRDCGCKAFVAATPATPPQEATDA